jgi:hypothetical protein
MNAHFFGFCEATPKKMGIHSLDLLRWGHQRVKKALFFPLCAFFRSNSRAMLPQKAFKWKENSSFFPLR